eukprot:3362288-Amphidinium_carterae.1
MALLAQVPAGVRDSVALRLAAPSPPPAVPLARISPLPQDLFVDSREFPTRTLRLMSEDFPTSTRNRPVDRSSNTLSASRPSIGKTASQSFEKMSV